MKSIFTFLLFWIENMLSYFLSICLWYTFSLCSWRWWYYFVIIQRILLLFTLYKNTYTNEYILSVCLFKISKNITDREYLQWHPVQIFIYWILKRMMILFKTHEHKQTKNNKKSIYVIGKKTWKKTRENWKMEKVNTKVNINL